DSHGAVNHDHVPVDFDDSDNREVPLSGLRILPGYFTNLCELVSVTGGELNIMNVLEMQLCHECAVIAVSIVPFEDCHIILGHCQ
ncbi:unnamed protein product, partial [Trichobilharzia szidati]